MRTSRTWTDTKNHPKDSKKISYKEILFESNECDIKRLQTLKPAEF